MPFIEGVSDCDVCAIGKSTQPAHPKKANLKVSNPFGLVYTNFMGPTLPAALGGCECVSKITHKYTKWTEVFFIQAKREAEGTIKLYVKSPVAPLGYRIVCLRADRGTQYTGSTFQEYCRHTAIQL